MADPDAPSASTPVMCTLTTKDAAARVLEWEGVRAALIATSPIVGGARLTLPAALEASMADLAERETGCCSFLAITTRVESDHLLVDITSENPDGRPVIELIAGTSLA